MNLRRGFGWLSLLLLASGAILLAAGIRESSRTTLPLSVAVLPGSHGGQSDPGPLGTLPPGSLPAGSGVQGPGNSTAISIPTINLDQAPIHDRGPDGTGGMAIAPGYSVTRFSSSAPFGLGNTVLYGHDDIDGSVFARLGELKKGDLVIINQAGAEQYYVVESRQVVSPTAVQILAPTKDARLTIFTCWPTFVDSQRVVITATQIAEPTRVRLRGL